MQASLSPPLVDPSAAPLAARFHAVRQATLALAAGLSAEDQQVQSMPDASPTKWHLAHSTWFFETFLLKPHLAGYQPADPVFHYLFNSYYEAEGPRQARAERGLITRPSADEVLHYRRHVDEAMSRLLQDADPVVAALLELGLNHEQQHQELILMDIKHVLSRNPINPAYGAEARQPVRTRPADWFSFPEGLYAVGHEGSGFAFDNEGPRHRCFLEAFDLADRLVTCGEYLEFMADGGYNRPELWLSDGWAMVNKEGWRAPLYWQTTGAADWRVFTLSGAREIAPSEPVCHVSHYEADAFARWAGGRLPTEAEWEAASATGLVSHEPIPQGLLHPAPATTSAGLRQMYGQVWQWTASAYLPYPRYRAAPGAVGEYNGKFMSGQMVLRGSSMATPPGHGRATYRNFFPPQARWAFSGLRLARDA